MDGARRFTSIIIVVIAAALLLTVLSYLNISRILFSQIGRLTSPIFSSIARAAAPVRKVIAGPFQSYREKDRIEEIAAALRLSAESKAQLSELERENGELRRELSFYEQQRYPIVVARIVLHTHAGGADFFNINRGARDGIEIGAPVVIGGTIIGKIIRVQDYISVVSPLWVAPVKTAATFAGSEKTNGIVEGELNAGLKMSLIPKDVSISDAAIVITSGLEEKIPRGLIIGMVEHVSSETNDLFQTAYLRTLVTANDTAVVSVISSFYDGD